MKRSFALLLTSVMLVVSLTACGKDRVDGAGEGTDGAYNGAGDMTDGAYDGTGGMTDDAYNGAGDLADDARDAMDDMGDAARDMVRGAEDALTGDSNHETNGYTNDRSNGIG